MPNLRCALLLSCIFLFSLSAFAQAQPYPQGYFRNPLAVPMQLVANFGELRSNHWHMGLDIRTQQRENLPVYAAAEGYIAKIKIEPNGFGRAIYIAHPNGFTTLYAHLNDFAPALEQWVRAEQYKAQSWEVELQVPPQLFPVAKGELIAYSGNTGGSQGPHVHFEIRETATDKCLNPMLFGFPITDAVPPVLSRLAVYDRTQSVYSQTPKLVAVKKSGGQYGLAAGNVLTATSERISFAIGATDKFSGYTNPNGIYAARIYLDDVLQSAFELDRIDYDETRYLNAHTDYRYKASGGPWLQHLSRMPGDTSAVYPLTSTDGILHLTDTGTHKVRIEVNDAADNQSILSFNLRYKPIEKNYPAIAQQLIPQQVNIFEQDGFELYASEFAVYDTANVTFSKRANNVTGSASPLYTFCNATIPTHDSVMVRIQLPEGLDERTKQKLVIKSVSGSRTVTEKAKLAGDWAFAKFRQFGTYQLLADTMLPSVNAPGAGAIVYARKLRRLVFTPQDNIGKIDFFSAAVDGQWLRFTNDKGRSWVYVFDEHFPPGEHRLRVTVRDIAGNETVKEWTVIR